MKVLLGITGCIAAYKAPELLRQLQKRGCDDSCRHDGERSELRHGDNAGCAQPQPRLHRNVPRP